MKKKLTKLICLLFAIVMAFSASACFGGGGGDSDSDNTLDIYLLYKGYGDAWLQDAMDRFKKEDWVKEKYPNLTVNYTFNSLDADAPQKLSQGASINKYDLMFGVNLQGYESRGLIADLTDLVYLTEVPGEPGVKVIDKVPQNVRDKIRRATGAPIREDGGDSYYVVSYVDGMFGMLYNQDILDQLDLEVPLTTDHFLEVAAEIASKGYKAKTGTGGAEETQNTVIMNNAKDKYWNSSFSAWWGQYVGVEGFSNFFEGYDAGEDVYNSINVLDMPGRLETLEFIQSALTNYQYKFSSSFSTDKGYKEAQTRFLMGDGAFHYNGDYFSTEMMLESAALKGSGIDYDIKFMKMPVLSAMVKTLENKDMPDTLLRQVIKEVDNDVVYANSALKSQVSENDFNKIADARCIIGLRTAVGQAAVIPSYSPAKGLAADFLRFMYTTESIKSFVKSSGGLVFPTTYDVRNDTSLTEYITDINKSKLDLLRGTSNYQVLHLPAEAATTLGKGGLTALKYDGTFESNFNVNNTNLMTPSEILAAERAHWEGGWEQMLSAAGIR